MSKLKVNELDTESGTTITVTTTKTLDVPAGASLTVAGTQTVTGTQTVSGAQTNTGTLDISGATVTLPATLPATVGTNITDLPGANIIGTIPLAALSNAPATDLTSIEDDLALLGFKVASNGSLAKYNLDDQTVDAFEDATGIDALASIDAYRDVAKYYSGTEILTGAGYGFAGGTSQAAYTHAGGGGGGAGGVGANATSASAAGNGGLPRGNSFRTGSSVDYAGGGGGGIWSGGGGAAGGGGSTAGSAGNTAAGDATANSGGGAGGNGGQANQHAGGNGGSGIIVIRYLAASAAGTGGTITTYGSGGSQYQVHSFTNSAASEDLVLASGVTMDIMIVGGGGAGGGIHAGGGGGGGVMEITGWAVEAGTYAAVVGAGGVGVLAGHCAPATPNGVDSSFNANQIAKGGGGGGTYCSATPTTGNEVGNAGGSGGGAAGGGSATLGGGATNQGDPASGGINNMTLQSNATTAVTAPTKGDIVMTYTNGAGTATLNTDLTAEFSADNGSNWTSTTLVAQGSTGTHLIVSAHNVTLTSASGTAMKYRMKTFNQAAALETRIQAVSLGWS